MRISDRQLEILMAIREDGRMTGIEVARSTGISTNGIYVQLDRLEHEGFLQKDLEKRFLLTGLGNMALDFGRAERAV